jgi:hypothetical protein
MEIGNRIRILLLQKDCRGQNAQYTASSTFIPDSSTHDPPGSVMPLTKGSTRNNTVQTLLLVMGKREGKIIPVLNYIIKHYAMKGYGGVEAKFYHS